MFASHCRQPYRAGRTDLQTSLERHPGGAQPAESSGGASSERMSMRQPVSRAASRAF